MMKGTFVLGITGAAYHGKSFFGRFLMETCRNKGMDVRKVAFADELKKMARQLGWNGEKDERGRKLLQLLATDVCRECIDWDYWVMKWRREVIPIVYDYEADLVIADDVRFDNEAKAIHLFKPSYILKIHCPNPQIPPDEIMNDQAQNHVSEKGINRSLINSTISVLYGLDHLKKAAEEFYEKVIRSQKEIKHHARPKRL